MVPVPHVRPDSSFSFLDNKDINWSRIGRAVEFYKSRGFTYVEVPWVAPVDVVQMDDRGTPYRCWTLEDTSVSNEGQSDGVYWQSPNGHLVHISGHYNRVQVSGGRWVEAYRELGLTVESCRRVQERVIDL